jgi:hypothetical protein
VPLPAVPKTSTLHDLGSHVLDCCIPHVCPQVSEALVTAKLGQLLKRTGDFRTPEQAMKRMGITSRQLCHMVNLKVRGDRKRKSKSTQGMEQQQGWYVKISEVCWACQASPYHSSQDMQGIYRCSAEVSTQAHTSVMWALPAQYVLMHTPRLGLTLCSTGNWRHGSGPVLRVWPVCGGR